VSNRGITFYKKFESVVAQAANPDYYTTPQLCVDHWKLNCQVTLEAVTAGIVNISIQTSSDGMWWTAISLLTPAAVGTQQLQATGLLKYVRAHVNFSVSGAVASIWMEGILRDS
jgi:hypothetical protein